jgi:hypothetical protein
MEIRQQPIFQNITVPAANLSEPSLDEQLIAALEKTPAKEYTLETDKNGSLIIDKTQHPELYDWAVNG